MPFADPSSLSPLISRIHSSLFSDSRRTVSSKFFDTQVSSVSTKELVLPRHARCAFSRLCCNGHSLLLSSYLIKIGRIENSLTLWRLFVPLRPLVRASCQPVFWNYSRTGEALATLGQIRQPGIKLESPAFELIVLTIILWGCYIKVSTNKSS